MAPVNNNKGNKNPNTKPDKLSAEEELSSGLRLCNGCYLF
jgi:hypothetical protein